VRFLADREVVFDRQGFFRNYEDWFPEAAEALAVESGLDHLGPDHWRVINFLREFFEFNRRAPLNTQLKKGTGLSLMELEKLFPEGIKYGARRLAGLPNPKSCG
jgi:tRNA 2-thiouridine synthesizing protein E